MEKTGLNQESHGLEGEVRVAEAHSAGIVVLNDFTIRCRSYSRNLESSAISCIKTRNLKFILHAPTDLTWQGAESAERLEIQLARTYKVHLDHCQIIKFN